MGVRLAQPGTGMRLAVPLPIMTSRRLLLIVVFALGAATLLTGCGIVGGWAASGLLALALAALGAAGCSSSHGDAPVRSDAAVPHEDGRVPDDDAGAADAGTSDSGEGVWERCCNTGRIDTCFCPAGWACNYGWFTDCGGGACAVGPEMCPDADAGSGTYDPCCIDHRVSTCYCPPDVVCNYVPYEVCADGSCVDGFAGEVCAGTADAGAGVP